MFAQIADGAEKLHQQSGLTFAFVIWTSIGRVFGHYGIEPVPSP